MISDDLTTPSATTATTTDVGNAAKLLHVFDAAALGEGNANAAANILAAMALTIGNVQIPGRKIMSIKNRVKASLGSGFLVSGALSCSLLSDYVLMILQSLQNTVSDNARKKIDEEQIALERQKAQERQLAKAANFPAMKLTRDENPYLKVLLDIDKKSPLADFLNKPAGQAEREARHFPTIFANADTSAKFGNIVKSAHMGRPLVRVSLADSRDSKAFAQACKALMDGTYVPSTDRNVRGEIIVTDPGGTLANARVGDASAEWLPRLVWLTDESAGPNFELDDSSGDQILDTADRFDKALRAALQQRLESDGSMPPPLAFKHALQQASWIHFLSDLEPTSPGITSAVRTLPSNLYFGFLQMANKDIQKIHYEWLMSFARVLVLRMINTRKTKLYDSQLALLEKRIATIRHKLMEKPLTVRELTRKCHRLPNYQCIEVLEVMESSGTVTRNGKTWSLTADSANSWPIIHV